MKDDARIEKHHCCLRAIHQLMGTGGISKQRTITGKRAQTKYHRSVRRRFGGGGGVGWLTGVEILGDR